MSDWPLILPFAHARPGQELALASLVHRDGSSYRQPGARMLIAADGSHQGSLSGGCLEQGIAAIGRKVIEDGRARVETIDTRPHFGCPGTLTFLIESVGSGALLDEIHHRIQERKIFQIRTDFVGELPATRILDEDDIQSAGSALIETIQPCPRLIAVGSTPDLVPVFEIARILGWQCHQIVGPQGDASCALTKSSSTPPSDFASRFQADDFTAVIIMSHHLTLDLSYLKQILPRGYRYVGLLGSRHRRESILNELGEAGLLEDPGWIENFYAPVGLDLGSQHPSSIALAIVAEVQAVFSGSDACSLRDRLGSIHLPTNCPT